MSRIIVRSETFQTTLVFSDRSERAAMDSRVTIKYAHYFHNAPCIGFNGFFKPIKIMMLFSKFYSGLAP